MDENVVGWLNGSLNDYTKYPSFPSYQHQTNPTAHPHKESTQRPCQHPSAIAGSTARSAPGDTPTQAPLTLADQRYAGA